MSFLQKARDAASQVADQAKAAADSVAEKATDKESQDKLKQQMTSGMHLARRGMKSVIDRIDPGTLAEVIIKATAIQEMANKALKDKGSPYRISEISITATIPPGVNFAIGRVDDPSLATHGVFNSTELAAASDASPVLSLTGATDIADLAAEVDAGAIAEEPEPEKVDSSLPDATSRPW